MKPSAVNRTLTIDRSGYGDRSRRARIDMTEAKRHCLEAVCAKRYEIKLRRQSKWLTHRARSCYRREARNNDWNEKCRGDPNATEGRNPASRDVLCPCQPQFQPCSSHCGLWKKVSICPHEATKGLLTSVHIHREKSVVVSLTNDDESDAGVEPEVLTGFYVRHVEK